MRGATFLRWSARWSARCLLSAPGHTGNVTTGPVRRYRHVWTTVRRTGTPFTGGGVSVLLGLASLPAVGHLVYRRVQHATLHALEHEEVLEHADYLYSCGETEKLYQLLIQHKDSEDAEFLWRLARACRDVSMQKDRPAEERRGLTFESLRYAEEALRRNDACFAAHKWYAICLSDIGDYEGVKVKIGNSYIIKEHLERAIELNPKDATSIHIMGHWCFAFAELAWYQRKVAAMIFASPPTATYEEALAYFLKAEEVDPNFYSKNLLMLGKTYLGLQDQASAVLWLRRARDYPPHTQEDREVHQEALELLKKLNA